jgi:hypothetical protein
MDSTQKKLKRYITRGGEHRSPLEGILHDIQRELPETVIFGGMIRDFGLSAARHFSSDIDLVTTAPARDIYSLIKEYQPVQNKFGGFRFSVSNRLFDIWSLQDTWAIREGHVEGCSIESLLKTTFFNLDAAFFKISDYRICASESYELNLSKRLLDINLKKNPNPRQMAIRAVRMAIVKDLYVAPNLAEFVLSELFGQGISPALDSYVKDLYVHSLKRSDDCFKYEPQLSIW